MQTYSISEGRKILGDIIKQVKYQKKIIGMGSHNKTEVLIVPYEQIQTEVDVSAVNSASSSFNFLADEPDLYSLEDLKEVYK